MSPRPHDDDDPSPGVDADRGVGELLLTALAGSALVPIVQAMATKFGEDVYAKIGNLLPGRRKGQRDDEHPIVLADPTTATVLEIPPRLSEKDTYALATVRMPSVAASQWLLIRYDPASRTWIATAVAAPPPDAIEVENQQ